MINPQRRLDPKDPEDFEIMLMIAQEYDLLPQIFREFEINIDIHESEYYFMQTLNNEKKFKSWLQKLTQNFWN
jgi:hypothetical protein